VVGHPPPTDRPNRREYLIFHAANGRPALPWFDQSKSVRTSTVTVLSRSAREIQRRGELAGGCVPMVNASLFVAGQHVRDVSGDPPGSRRRVVQLSGEYRPHLRDRHRRCFFPCTNRSWDRNHRPNSDRVM